MTTFDFSPLYRSTVGFDRLARLMDASLQTAPSTQNGFPPYDIAVVGEDQYRITLAVAGFGEEDLEIQVSEQVLTVSGKVAGGQDATTYLHRGIAERSFIRKFQLADFVEVTDAHLDSGLLTIDLVREVPERMKPRTIEIERGAPKTLLGKAKSMIEKKSKAA